MQSSQPQAIELSGKPIIGGRFPAICAPLVGRTREHLLSEAAAVAAKQPDIIEWRADFFEKLADMAETVELATCIKRAAGGITLLFTCRSVAEGGEKIALSEAQVVDLYRVVCASGQVDLVDFEMNSDPARVAQVRELSRARGVRLILSFHDFDKTPALDFLNECFARAQSLQADIAKVAVMPRSMEDVLTLLTATLQSSRALEIPVMSMAMGGWGALTRVCGWAFGSAMTFGVGQGSSAAGQLPVEDLRAGLAVLHKALGKSVL